MDITELIESMRSTSVILSVNFVYSASVTALPWLGFPLISPMYRWLLNWILTQASKSIEMEAFFLNTIIRKNSQAGDYIDAIRAKNSLPPSATNEEFKAAEQKEIESFNSFVRVTL